MKTVNQQTLPNRHAVGQSSIGCAMLTVGTIPTGLHHSAQGWPRQRTTLGKPSKIFFNPNGVASFPRGALMQPFQGSCRLLRQPRVARSAQPWAERFESLQDSLRALKIFSSSSFSSSSSIFSLSITRTRTTTRTIRCVSAPLRLRISPCLTTP